MDVVEVSEEDIVTWKRVQSAFRTRDDIIVDVPNYYTLPSEAQKTISHIHTKGKCVKREAGKNCEWPDD